MFSSLSSEDGDAHLQYAHAAIEATNPKVAMALKSHKARDLDLRSVWLLDNQTTFNLCCNLDFSGKRCNAKQAMNMSGNRVVCKFPRNVWFLVIISGFTTRATSNIICL